MCVPCVAAANQKHIAFQQRCPDVLNSRNGQLSKNIPFIMFKVQKIGCLLLHRLQHVSQDRTRCTIGCLAQYMRLHTLPTPHTVSPEWTEGAGAHMLNCHLSADFSYRRLSWEEPDRACERSCHTRFVNLLMFVLSQLCKLPSQNSSVWEELFAGAVRKVQQEDLSTKNQAFWRRVIIDIYLIKFHTCAKYLLPLFTS